MHAKDVKGCVSVHVWKTHRGDQRDLKPGLTWPIDDHWELNEAAFLPSPAVFFLYSRGSESFLSLLEEGSLIVVALKAKSKSNASSRAWSWFILGRKQTRWDHRAEEIFSQEFDGTVREPGWSGQWSGVETSRRVDIGDAGREEERERKRELMKNLSNVSTDMSEHS